MAEVTGKQIGAVMVVGGGIAGMQSALDLADSGFKVYLVEERTSIGGRMSQLDKVFPTSDCAMCLISPKLIEVAKHPNIEIITNAVVEALEGEAGNFRARVLVRPRYVDLVKCSGCGDCVPVCPVEMADDFNLGLSRRKAIGKRYPQAIPGAFAITRTDRCGECRKCVEVCQAGAIDLDQKEECRELAVGSVVLTPGFDLFDATLKGEYGYGRLPNVITNLEFERILSASGPFQGKVRRPSDGKTPTRIGWIQCVGSRDTSCGRDYCSSICCMYATDEAIISREHDKAIQPTIFFNDIRAFGKGYERYYQSARYRFGVRYINSIPSTVKELQQSHNLLLEYVAQDGKKVTEEFDLVVLSVGLIPSASSRELARRIGIEVDRFGFNATDGFHPGATSRPGVFAAGAFAVPMDITESLITACASACLASQPISTARGTLVSEKEYPPEKDVAGEEPRVGVFICRCGTNIARVVDVVGVAAYARTIPHVVHAEENLYTCSTDTQQKILRAIREKDLNRVVVASCSPRTHESLFQETIREGGLNKYLFEMANIRDQCSWVHASHMPQATHKAKDLVRMAVARAVQLQPLRQRRADITRRVLIIGGGLAGMEAARSIAAQGFEAVLVERDKELGGNLKRIFWTVDGADPQALLAQLTKQVESDPRIKIFKEAEVTGLWGFLGNYTAEIKDVRGETARVEHGVTIIATGGSENRPDEYLYGQSPRVLTQLELEKRLSGGKTGIEGVRQVTMIQCVGSREPEHPYCSRVCCSQAVKNSIRLKQLDPDIEVAVLYRDMRTYGMEELQYRRAREMGVVFIRYQKEKKPEVAEVDGRLTVTVRDKALIRDVALDSDLVVLSTAIRPQPDVAEFASRLKLPLTLDRFFMEGHMKLRPLGFSEGMYLCGLAHSPKTITESLSQAHGAVSRAVTVLSRPYLMVGGVVSVVDPDRCAACLTCMRSCPFDVPRLGADGKAYIEAAECQGCGICAGLCPRKAITLQHYSDVQIMAKTAALVGAVGER
jgi:heterodisulfide reductase subunit A2